MAELKALKKGDLVVLRMFTGMAVGKKEVIAADAKTVTLETKTGKAKFSRKDGLQIEPAAKEARFANYITEDDGSYEKELAERKAKRDKKKAAEKPKKTKKPEPTEEEAEETEEEEIPAPAKIVSKKTAKKSASKKSKKAPAEDDEEFDDEYEEVE